MGPAIVMYDFCIKIKTNKQKKTLSVSVTGDVIAVCKMVWHCNRAYKYWIGLLWQCKNQFFFPTRRRMGSAYELQKWLGNEMEPELVREEGTDCVLEAREDGGQG